MIAATRVSRASGIRIFLLGLGSLLMMQLPGMALSTEVSGYSAGGGVFTAYPISGVPVLDSFYFRYTNADHHVQAIAVDPASPIPNPSAETANTPAGQIFLTLQDHNRDDEFFYSVKHATVPTGVYRQKTYDFCKKSCSQWLSPPSSRHVFVITGFTLSFPGTDHHLRRVAIAEQGGELTVHFADGNGDDLFKYEIEYVYLPPEMIAKMGHEEGKKALGGETRDIDLGLLPTGSTIIRGFDFEFLPDLDVGITQDQHIRDIGVRTPGSKIEVYYGDKEINDGGDRFDWSVDWAALSVTRQSQPIENSNLDTGK